MVMDLSERKGKGEMMYAYRRRINLLKNHRNNITRSIINLDNKIKRLKELESRGRRKEIEKA